MPIEPNPEFIKKNKKLIEDYFLNSNPSITENIALELSYHGYGGSKSIDHFDSKLLYLKSLKRSQMLVKLYLKALRTVGRGEQKMDDKYIYDIDLGRVIMPNEEPLIFQKEAIDKLEAYFKSDITTDIYQKLGWHPALLVMPTGSGKTMTSMWFLLDKMIKNGYKVLWLTHRELLLEQAFNTSKWLAKVASPKKSNHLKARIISGVHSPPSTASFQNEDIIYYSIQSLGRNFDRLDFLLEGVFDNKLIVVIDEAHHTPMHTYRKALEFLKQSVRGFKLLGLTATPYRTIDSERKVLNHIYNSKYIGCISMSELIKKRFLATPYHERVETDWDAEAELTNEDKEYINKFGDINEETATKIAQSKKRNQCIIKQLIDNRQKYGKTLIFAVNQIHAITLAKDLSSKGIKTEYVINGQNNKQVIERFIKNEIDVLVNVQILTEGSDIPDIKSVFITRPTKSESMLLQMIGRALRGPKMHGTEIAYIVDFHDKWSTFQKWLNPEFILTSEDKDFEPSQPPKTEIPPGWIPIDTVNKIYENLHSPYFEHSFHSALPDGWYSLAYEDDQGKVENILVYDNARPAFESLEKDIGWLVQNKASIKMVLDKYFSDIEDPFPNIRELDVLLQIAIKEHKFPEYYKFNERHGADAKTFALQMYEGNIPPKNQKQTLINIYNDNSLIEQIYSEFNDFFTSVMKEYNKIINPDIDIVDNPDERRPSSKKRLPKLADGPKHNLTLLYEKVIKEMFDKNLNKPSIIGWSTMKMKRYWGYFRNSDRKLIINNQLDSPDVPQNIIEFVIYHELLHANGNLTHNKEFRKLEHKFPKWEECDHFLSTFHENFKLD